MNKKIPKQIPKTHNRNDSNRVSQKDLYEELWHGRDFEIQTLWQRSIFLTAFLVLVFSGYGILWLKYLELTPQISFNSYLDWLESIPMVYTLTLGMLAIFGYSISLLWIMMAKGAKYWVECYESGISRVLNTDELYRMTFNRDLVSNWDNQDKQNQFPTHGELPESNRVSSCLLSTDGGRYSVSRINILVGQVSGSFFVLAMTVHLVSLYLNIWWSSIIYVFAIITIHRFLRVAARSKQSDSRPKCNRLDC